MLEIASVTEMTEILFTNHPVESGLFNHRDALFFPIAGSIALLSSTNFAIRQKCAGDWNKRCIQEYPRIAASRDAHKIIYMLSKGHSQVACPPGGRKQTGWTLISSASELRPICLPASKYGGGLPEWTVTLCSQLLKPRGQGNNCKALAASQGATATVAQWPGL